MNVYALRYLQPVSISVCQQVKQKSLMSHEARVNKLNDQTAELLRRGRVPVSVEESMKQLNERWTSTNKRLSMDSALFY